MSEGPARPADDPAEHVTERPTRPRSGWGVPGDLGHRADLGHQTSMDVVEPASDGCRRSVPICRHLLRVHGVEAMSAERPLDWSRLASPPRVQGVEGVFLPRGEMAKEILGRPVAPADRCPALEVLVLKPFHELADRLVFLLECA
jgi:hypothetical protein